MLRAIPDTPSPRTGAAPDLRAVTPGSPIPTPAAVPSSSNDDDCASPDASAPPRRQPILSVEDYGIPLPAWLQECIRHVPPGAGESCPTDSEALLASAFDFAYQLHEGQYRASGEPYIIHPVAVADLLRDIGGSAAVIAVGILHEVV